MCRSVSCKVCGKTTWAGCGQHVDQVMAGVPRADRCPGHTEAEQQTALDAVREGFGTTVLLDLVAGVAEDSTATALAELRAAGVTLA